MEEVSGAPAEMTVRSESIFACPAGKRGEHAEQAPGTLGKR